MDPLEYDFVYGYPPLSSLPTTSHPDLAIPATSSGRLALYVHLPFCSYGCTFCYFSKTTNARSILVERYLEFLGQEIKAASARLRGTRVTSVYFGGGTPTYLSTDQLSWLVKLLTSSFRITRDSEWTVEASPETATLEKLSTIVALGVNRISLGVQTFNSNRRGALSRLHSPAQTESAFRAIQESGAPRANLDLIYGYPDQDPEEIWDELKSVAEAPFQSVTWYQLWQHMDTPLRRETLRGTSISALDLLRIKCNILAGMTELGYQRDKVDWFLREPRFSQHQQEHKWSGGDLLGLGASAYGYIDGVYYRNFSRLRAYEDSIRRFGWAVERAARLTEDQKVRRRLMLGVKLRGGVNLDILERGSADLGNELVPRVVRLAKSGLLEECENHLRLSPLGQLYGDDVVNTLGLSSVDRVRREQFRRYLLPLSVPHGEKKNA